MPSYNKRSLSRLDTCDIRIGNIFRFVIRFFDNSILCGHRGQVEQDKAFIDGNSKARWPNGDHNKEPSKAVDAGPYDPRIRGVNWDVKVIDKETKRIRLHALRNLCRFYLFAGFVLGVAAVMGITLGWGGDWDGDTDISPEDQQFNDLVHFFLKD